MIRPMRSSGANTADRVPTTTSMSPRRMRCHWSWRSPSESAAVLHATRSPNAPRNCATIAGVSAISGTSISTRRPASRTAADEPQVDLRLAAARHAVHERDMKRLRIGQRPQALERRFLLVRQAPAGIGGRDIRWTSRVERIAIDARPAGC